MNEHDEHRSIDMDALLRYVSGESSLEEMAEISRRAAIDEELQETLALLEDAKKQGLLEEPFHIPMESMAAAAEGNLCDVLCEQHILREYYPEEDACDTLGVAIDNAWLKDSGTPLYNAGRLFEKHGWPVSRSYGRTLPELSAELAQLHHAIAVVDSGMLWKGVANGILHAVVVLSVDGDAVRVWDPASEANATYTADEFLAAWNESKRYLVIASSEGMEYIPRPADVSMVTLDPDLLELGEAIAENVHDVWAKTRMAEGWRYGDHRDDKNKLNPDLVPYAQLPEGEKNYDRYTAFDTLKLVRLLGFEIRRKPTEYCQTCGGSVHSDYTFCPHCGCKLEHWE